VKDDNDAFYEIDEILGNNELEVSFDIKEVMTKKFGPYNTQHLISYNTQQKKVQAIYNKEQNKAK